LNRCGEKALAKGVDETILLAMKDAQAIAFTYDSTNPAIITGIALGTGEKFYAYQGVNYSNDASVGFAKSDFDITLPQTVTFKIFSNSAATKKEIEALLTRKDLIVIMKRVAGDYELFGAETGMTVSNFVYQPNSDDKGAFTVTLSAEAETSLPKTVKHVTSSLDDTVSFLAGLTTIDA